MSPLLFIATAASLAVLLGGCTANPDLDRAESELSEHYLEQLPGAGMRYTFQRTCNIDGATAPGKWHLQVELRVMTTVPQLAELFANAGAVVVSDRDPIIVQQNPGKPESGWNGSVRAGEHGASLLGLRYNNVEIESPQSALGWAEACEEDAG
jgi:hypothetical protein